MVDDGYFMAVFGFKVSDDLSLSVIGAAGGSGKSW